tara:strand:+ start:146 stop:358 length:213 start_codon:yes stop_codon:yes gene_type:complete
LAVEGEGKGKGNGEGKGNDESQSKARKVRRWRIKNRPKGLNGVEKLSAAAQQFLNLFNPEVGMVPPLWCR